MKKIFYVIICGIQSFSLFGFTPVFMNQGYSVVAEDRKRELQAEYDVALHAAETEGMGTARQQGSTVNVQNVQSKMHNKNLVQSNVNITESSASKVTTNETGSVASIMSQVEQNGGATTKATMGERIGQVGTNTINKSSISFDRMYKSKWTGIGLAVVPTACLAYMNGFTPTQIAVMIFPQFVESYQAHTQTELEQENIEKIRLAEQERFAEQVRLAEELKVAEGSKEATNGVVEILKNAVSDHPVLAVTAAAGIACALIKASDIKQAIINATTKKKMVQRPTIEDIIKQAQNIQELVDVLYMHGYTKVDFEQANINTLSKKDRQFVLSQLV